jgi:molybdopterin molybdotransferase
MRIYGVAGWKNAGKTGLMERLVAEISARGFTVSTVKHAHHRFDVDQPGRDSYRHREAGAGEVLLSSSNRWALMHELRDEDEPTLAQHLARLQPCDLVLIEGYKRDDHPKIEAHRAETGNPLIAPEDATVRAVASDVALPELLIPVFDLDDTKALADFVMREVGLIASDTAKPDITPPRLKNDCFALPPGVSWVPVEDALTRLQDRLTVVVGSERVASDAALGRVLAAPVLAARSNPPGANSAVDGYGFAHSATGAGPQLLPLVDGRAAAGVPFAGAVPLGEAIRILTGALLPPGVDTVVLQEDVTVAEGHVAFEGPVRAGANARTAGEDVLAGDVAIAAGRLLRAPEIALAHAIGAPVVQARKRLRVGVLSTGDEIVASGSTMAAGKTFDANRPMLLSLAESWGYEPVDLGHVADARDPLRAALNQGAARADVMLTSGGASAGEEDHVSALLSAEGDMKTWRIAVKPGRPLALALWDRVPVFGLPGNPVAALVCTLIFGRPAFSMLAGAGWVKPQGFMVPAAFEKNKKPGRREYLRARMNEDGQVEVFKSEGSGRISGLSWAGGLVELGDAAQNIRPGDLVRYYPYASFGI